MCVHFILFSVPHHKVHVQYLVTNRFAITASAGNEAFGAAGIEGLQLVFYPSGYCGATEGVVHHRADTGTRSQYPWFWVNYNDLIATSLEIMVNKGNHPQMALIQVRYYFAQMVVVFVWISDHFWVFVDISSFKKVAYSDKTVVRFLLCHL